MKLSYRLPALFILLICSFTSTSQSIDASRIDNKVICGYQGWFNCAGDGSPLNTWVHWATSQPGPSSLSFELFPDVSQYDSQDLYATNFPQLGNGADAKLFSSYPERVIQLHFNWMETYGIDGVAVQRFISHVPEPQIMATRDSIAARAARAAEDHGRIFYTMYDISGIRDELFRTITEDWQTRMETDLKITDSPAYAHQDGKPVVAIWGLGFTHTHGTAEESLALVNWFKERGYFVIGGIPTYWRSGDRDAKPGFQEVFRAMDMLSPWTVGRFGHPDEADHYRQETLAGDYTYCQENGLHYQPVLFPGFAWSKWNGGPRNEIPRAGGDLFWRQAYNIRSEGIPGAYIAMFDEYDEATAIMPAADSYFGIPEGEYFLTLAADGRYRSADFYLRLAGEITDLFGSDDPPSADFSTASYQAPYFFRTSFEAEVDAQPDWINTNEETTALTNTSGPAGTGNPRCELSDSEAFQGEKSMHIQGLDRSSSVSLSYFKVFDVDIPIGPDTYLSYLINPQNEGGRNVAVDLIMTDESNLRDSDAVDSNGNDLHPGAPRGTIQEWTLIESKIGDWLAGKTIDRIVIAYDYGPEERPYSAFIDNIKIQNLSEAEDMVSPVLEREDDGAFLIYPNPLQGRDRGLLIESKKPGAWPRTSLKITNYEGREIAQYKLTEARIRLDTSGWSKGIYFLTFTSGDKRTTRKLVFH
ncbi:xylosidase [Flavilitoribacter nigricans DSM 23189 = NBRC 102662]|uniref:Xylosidase n=2 Tax=Flavilitoribacter TaxID=2762562 RepID=A0A2D0NCS5_FLAN2|nr:xylosidase [Flavilitoribacter nigricans DSM 23189 = NBRC 102662]